MYPNRCPIWVHPLITSCTQKPMMVVASLDLFLELMLLNLVSVLAKTGATIGEEDHQVIRLGSSVAPQVGENVLQTTVDVLTETKPKTNDFDF